VRRNDCVTLLGDHARVATRPAPTRRPSRTDLGALLTIALVLLTGLLVVAGWSSPPPGTWGFRGFAAILAMAFGGVGFVITSRVGGNRVGVLLIAIGLSAAVVAFTIEYAAYGIVTNPGSLPGAVGAAWLVAWDWVLFATLVAPFLLLLFPDGHLPSRAWRPVAALGVVAAILIVVSMAFRPGPINNAPYIDNPAGVPEAWAGAMFALALAGFVLLAATIALAALTLVLRYRHAGGVARQQLKWFASAAVFAGGVLVGPGTLLNIAVTGDPARSSVKGFEVLTILGFLLIPLATGIAILRYRLYDIDRVLSRTIAWSLASLLLALLFVGVVLALQGLLTAVTGGGTLAVAASTLLVAGLARPIAGWIQAAIDRRFFRARYDGARTVDAFAARLRAEVDLGSIRGDILETVATTVRPGHAELWIRPGEPVSLPAVIDAAPPPRLSGGA
jgi:hypothetical protein